jgi:two-component system OmpR family response regulator
VVTLPRVRVLVVEDDRKMSRILSTGLQEEGWAVDAVTDGDAALLQAPVYDYDCIVLDVNLPGRDGFEVCRTLREREVWAPVLMVTARDAVPDRVAGLDAGADDYLVKPFAFDELLARIRALTRRRAAERPARLIEGDLELDPATQEVTRGGVPIELTAKEYALLEYLLRHAGEVLSRTRILEHVWDVNYTGLSNVVDVYVGYLRAKVDRPFATPLIHTVRGRGYCLRAGD